MQKLDGGRALNQKGLMTQFDAISTMLRYACFVPADLGIGTSSAAKVKLVSAPKFTVNGVFKTISAATEVAFTATTDDIPASASAVQECMYLLVTDGSTHSLVKGTIASGSGNAKLPEIPAGKTPLGAVRVAVAAGATPFDATTDLLSAGHITDTYYDFGPLGPRFDNEL